ncbi:MAG: VIT domain-containing protein, partial [Planctomycetota bacterium]
LLPGDQVRTPKRGAHAVELRLAGGGRLVLGPGTLIEIPNAHGARLYTGDLEAKGALTLTGPGDFARQGDGTVLLRAAGRTTKELKSAPRWLAGYRNSSTDEWMGSLVAQVDGRNVPLTIGHHKVNVDIRDQIARTTIETSFVNRTNGTLEGTFYFPLPADASISGFGMWIGGELVEADIVEKQRARAIFEDILRRREDPGLLEWTGGNLFKARVFPIFGNSEKRIRIQYTQVLPLEGSTLRYRYALRSEMLRRTPLRSLRVQVRVHSSRPILSLACPSHEVRTRRTKHAASVEFDAETYTPERDFELRIGFDKGRPLTVIPHRRGDDGYFMLQLSPPDPAAGAWTRGLLPDSEPLDIVVIADTSGSMHQGARATQLDFLQSLLALLGEKDRVRLLTCDVEPQWYDKPVDDEALDWLDARRSLGWTDLDAAFDALQGKISKETVVIYVGDGVGTTGDADPVALADRLRRLGLRRSHAIATSSTYEKGVLEAIGTLRDASAGPVVAAAALIAEVAQPTVENLKISFDGLRTARVYPERLPNLPAGQQQIVLGRFQPTAGDQKGTVTINGTLAGKPVRYTAELALKADEEGNSFLPRLWARRHVDALLQEGRTPAVKSEIVSFSEEFGIMTPYTSLLVLESDQQRERYGVQRRVKMRDGERFFADGRGAATRELQRKQMLEARAWVLDLRRRMLREIRTMGLHLHDNFNESFPGSIGLGGGAGGYSDSPLFFTSRAESAPRARAANELLDEMAKHEDAEDWDAEEWEGVE